MSQRFEQRQGAEHEHEGGEAEEQLWPGKRTRVGAAMQNAPLDPVNAESDPRRPDIARIRAAIGTMGSGQPLNDQVASGFGAQLGTDLGGVRVHENNEGAAALGAQAFTHGDQIAFAPGVDPQSDGGQHILAHELVHVAQNMASGGASMELAARLDVGPSNSPVEREAESGASALMSGQSFRATGSSNLPGISMFDGPGPTPAPAPGATPPPPPAPAPAPAPKPTPAAPQSKQPPAPPQPKVPAPTPGPTQTPKPVATPNRPGLGPAPMPTARPTPQSPTEALDARVKEELEKRADPALKTGYGKATSQIDILRIQAVQYSFQPTGVGTAILQSLWPWETLKQHGREISLTNPYDSGSLQAWLEGARGVIRILGDVAAWVATVADIIAAVSGLCALISSWTGAGLVIFGVIAAIAAEIGTAAGLIKILLDLVDVIIGIVQMILTIQKIKASKDPAERAKLGALLGREVKEVAGAVTGIIVQVGTIVVTAGVAAGVGAAFSKSLKGFKGKFVEELAKEFRPLINRKGSIKVIKDAMALPIRSPKAAVRETADATTITQKEIADGAVTLRRIETKRVKVKSNLSRAKRKGKPTVWREVVATTDKPVLRPSDIPKRAPKSAKNIKRELVFIIDPNKLKRGIPLQELENFVVDSSAVVVGQGAGQSQANAKKPGDPNSVTAPTSGPPKVEDKVGSSPLTQVAMWPTQLEQLKATKEGLGPANDRLMTMYNLAKGQAGAYQTGQVEKAFAGVKNNAGQMRLTALQQKADATEGATQSEKGAQAAEKGKAQTGTMKGEQGKMDASTQKMGAQKVEKPPPKEGGNILEKAGNFLYNQTIGRIGDAIAGLQSWLTKTIGGWVMANSGLTKDELDMAGIDNSMRAEHQKDKQTEAEMKAAEEEAKKIDPAVAELMKHASADEQLAIQAMVESQQLMIELDTAQKTLDEAIVNGAAYIAEVSPIIRHELETQLGGKTIDAAYVAPVIGGANAFKGAIAGGSDDIAGPAAQDAISELAAAKATWPELDIGSGLSQITSAKSSFVSAHAGIVQSARGAADAAVGKLDALVGTMDYGAVLDIAHQLEGAMESFSKNEERAVEIYLKNLDRVIDATIQLLCTAVSQQEIATDADAPPVSDPATGDADIPVPAPAPAPTPPAAAAPPLPAPAPTDQPPPPPPAPAATPAPVQRKSTGGPKSEEDPSAIAGKGTAGSGAALPHLGAIQQSFGKHDVSGVSAHVGGDAAAASEQLGASAFASGNRVGFAGSPDLHTAAHEAAHVVQQRDGVSLKALDGGAGDAHEAHADAVADAVVSGKSAEPLLDQKPGGGSAGVQRKTEAVKPAAAGGAAGPKPLEDPVRSRMEASFGHSFDDVRVHEGGEATAVGAQAFARGSEIHFAPGQYNPETPEGMFLLGHELAHVVQQRAGLTGGNLVQARRAGGESNPLEAEADRVGTSIAGGGPAGRIDGGAAFGSRQNFGGDDEEPDSKMPMPVTMAPLGDRFEITFKSVAPGKMEVTATYKGGHGAQPKLVVLPIGLKLKDPKTPFPKFKPVVLARLEKELWLDLFGDSTQLIVLKDVVSPDVADFTKRNHHFELRANGTKVAVADVNILLGEGKADKPATGGPTDDLVSSQTVKLLGAAFQIHARRFGDSSQVQLRIDPVAAKAAKPSTALVTVKAPFAALGVKILKNDGRTVRLSLDKDETEDATIVHTVAATPDGAGQQHHLRTFDKDGILLAECEATYLGAKLAIPPAQDELTNKPDVNKEWPADRPPEQEDIAGENSRVVNRSGGIFEMRIDGDGDRGKELLVRFKAGKTIQTARDGTKLEVRVDIVQLSSGTVRSFDVTPTLSELKPEMWLAADGKNPAKIQMGSGSFPGLGSIRPMLEIRPPVDTDAGRSYHIVAGALEEITVHFPKEKTPTAPLVLDDLSQQSKETPKLGGVQFRDLMLGDYGDKFRFTLERTGVHPTFGVAGVNANGGVAADGFVLTNAFASVLEPISGNSTALTLRVAPDSVITIHDRITAMYNGPHAQEMPEVSREHFLTITGPAVPNGEEILKFQVYQGSFQSKYNREGPARTATTGTQTVGAMADQAAQGGVDNVYYAFTKKAEELRKEASDKGLITPTMYASWESLMTAMAELDPMTSIAGAMKTKPGDLERKKALQITGGLAADALSAEISDVTNSAGKTGDALLTNEQSEKRMNGGPGGWGYTNKYTGAHRQRFESKYQKNSGTLGLGKAIRDGEWANAYKLFDQLRVGFDKYIASKDKDLGGTLQYVSGVSAQMGKVINEGDGTPEGKPRRVYAHFVPDKKTHIEAREAPSSVPLQLYTWRSEGRWWLRDLTNPNHVYNDDVTAEGHASPPEALFKKLNWEEHFPNGIIRYQVPDGIQGALTIDDSDMDFWDWLEIAGLAIAVAGVFLASGGLATPALIAFAASGAIGIAGSIHNLVEKSDHNALDATTVIIDVGNIIANLAVVGQSASKILVNSARQAAIKGAAYTGFLARAASIADKSFMVLAGASIGGNVITVLAMSADAIAKLNAINEAGGDDSTKRRAVLTILATLIATGAMTALSIHGDLPALRGKQPPNIILDYVNGKAVAHAGGVRIGGGLPENAIKVDHNNPDAHAGSRWQSEDAAKAGDKDTQKAAQALLDDKEFMDWYRLWMAESKKVEFHGGKAKAKMPVKADGTLPPEHIQKRIQEFVDNPKTGIALYEKGFANADELRKLEEAAKKAGVELQLDPTHPDWNKNRKKLVAALGGDAQAEAMLKRYEHARSGALGDLDAYTAERAQLNQLVPDTELHRIRETFAGYEVYVTGGATQPGKPLGAGMDLDVFVVVPDGLKPDLMAAIEQRAKGMKVMPDPGYLKQHPSLPDGHTIGVDAKVMTKEQFFGMTTAHPGVNPKTGASRTPLRFHSLDAENDLVMRAVGESAAGRQIDPADMAELRRMIGIGVLDPAKLPVHMREKLPKQTGITEASAHAWADDLANSNPDKKTKAQLDEDLDKFLKRKEVVEALYEKAKKDPSVLPSGVTMEQLELAVKGDKNGVRVPLTFSVQGGKLGHDIEHAKKMFAEFQAELKAVFASEGINDAVVVQLGSGTTGWSTSPGMQKVNGVEVPKVDVEKGTAKQWSPTSDTDFAIFSDQALAQAMKEGATINPKNVQNGKFTTLKNTGKDGAKGFGDTPLGKKLEKLAGDWNERIYGKRNIDGFDFKMNLASDAPFKSAVPVLQVQNPKIVPLTGPKTSGTHAQTIDGLHPYFGVALKDPRVILPPNVMGRRDFHITIFSPAELAQLPADVQAAARKGLDIPGEPQAGAVKRHDIGDTPGYQLEVTWPEAQAYRKKYGLGPKELHVSLNGGIGEAIAKRDAARAAAPDLQE